MGSLSDFHAKLSSAILSGSYQFLKAFK